MKFFSLVTGIDKVLLNLGKVVFHYVPRSIYPDVVECWLGKHRIYSFLWVDGVDAYEQSKLGRVYAEFKKRSRK